MKYTEIFRHFLEDSMHKSMKIVTAVGTPHVGYLQEFDALHIVVSDKTTAFVDMKAVSSVELTNCNLADYMKRPDRDVIELS